LGSSGKKLLSNMYPENSRFDFQREQRLISTCVNLSNLYCINWSRWIKNIRPRTPTAWNSYNRQSEQWYFFGIKLSNNFIAYLIRHFKKKNFLLKALIQAHGYKHSIVLNIKPRYQNKVHCLWKYKQVIPTKILRSENRKYFNVSYFLR
jgi:hypothetical protein